MPLERAIECKSETMVATVPPTYRGRNSVAAGGKEACPSASAPRSLESSSPEAAQMVW